MIAKQSQDPNNKKTNLSFTVVIIVKMWLRAAFTIAFGWWPLATILYFLTDLLALCILAPVSISCKLHCCRHRYQLVIINEILYDIH